MGGDIAAPRARSGNVLSYARLFVALGLIALSLLMLLPAPTHFLWELSIAVDERGYWLVPLALAAAFLGRRQTRASRLATVGSLFSAAVLLIPLSQAAAIASHLDSDIDRAFHSPANSLPPENEGLSLIALLSSTSAPRPARTFAYPVADSIAASRGTDSLHLDFYPAKSNPNAPVVIMVHGGSWQSGARTDLPELNGFLTGLSYAVASVSYRFAPTYPFPAALEDVRTALRFLRNKSVELGIDTTRVVLAGRSAGGQLALLAAYTTRDPGIKGAIGLYAPADMTWGYNHPSNPRVLNSTAALEAYLNGSPATAEIRYLDASPFAFAPATGIPTLLLHGAHDELVSVIQSRRLDRRLTLYGVPHFFLELPWATHGCDFFINGPCGQLETLAVRRFLAIVAR